MVDASSKKHFSLKPQLLLLILSVCWAIFVYRLLLAVFPPYHQVRLTLAIDGPTATYRISFDSGSGYNAADVREMFLDSTNTHREYVELSTVLPRGPLRSLQIGLGGQPARMYLREICLSRLNGDRQDICWGAPELKQKFRPFGDLGYYEAVERGMLIVSTGPKPAIESDPSISEGISSFVSQSRWPYLLVSVLAGLLLFALFRRRISATPEFETAPITGSQSVLFLVMVVLGGCFLFFTQEIRQRVPPFQGPDENSHLAKLFSYEQALPCGEAPRSFLLLDEMFRPMAGVTHKKITAEMIASLFDSSAIADTSIGMLGTNACAYNSLYVASVSLFNKAFLRTASETSAVAYLLRARHATSILSLCSFLFSALLICFGRITRPRIARAEVIRAVGVVLLLYFMFLPQTLWMSSVLNQDYLLISGGLFFGLSVFLRIPVFSDLLLLFYLYAAASKVVYLLPASLLVAAHYWAVILKSKSIRCSFGALMLLVGAGSTYLALLAVNTFLCVHYNCYGIGSGSLFHNFSGFIDEIQIMLKDYSVLLDPESFHRDSAFGTFGWLEVPLPSRLANYYALVPSMLLVTAVACAPFYFFGTPFGAQRRQTCGNLILLAMGVWLLSFLAVYLIFVIMRDWCGAGSNFGCAYQRRYELPLYAPLLVILLVLAYEIIFKALSKVGASSRTIIVFTALMLAAQGICVWRVKNETLATLSERYFADLQSEKRYAENVKALESR